ncbi:MAG: HAMP domain-containing histidine kinase [Clostridia bacterium]|nr:HAMP domain-containing histidine kinase [Clostridia bacterium]
MKDKILTRVILIMTVAVFVTVALTFLLFNMYTINNTKEYLVQESSSFIKELEICYNDEDIKQKFESGNSADNYYKFVVLNSSRAIICGGDQIAKNSQTGEMEIVNGEKIDVAKIKNRNLEKVVRKGEAFFVAHLYQSGSTLNYAVRVDNPHFRDGYVIYICSVDLIYNSRPYFLVVVLAIVIWVGVIFASYIALTFNIKFATIPFEKIERILVDINNGEYIQSQIPQTLNFPEFKAVMTKIDDLAGEISKNFINLQYEQKKSSILLQSVNQGIIVVTKSGRVVLTNGAALEIFGRKNDNVVGVDLGYIVDDEELLLTLRQSLNEGKYYVGEVQIGEEIYRVETNFNTIQEKDVITGEVMLIVFTNVTIEVNSAKIRSEFFANASHELKTPLTAISGYAELMTMDGVSRSQLDKCVKEINGNALRMRSLIDDMLKLSKLDADLDNEEISKFDLGLLCKDVVEELQGVADSKQVKMSVCGGGDFIGKKKMMHTLVSNLVNNAVKYNKQGGHVWVSVEEDEGSVTVKVKDDGIGISKEHQSRLFERFYKVDTSRTFINESSTGLGLAIVKKIALIHGGKISLNSVPDEGTEFKVVFPKRLIEC